MHIDRRKNDTVWKGHYPALGRSKDPALDIVVQLQPWLRIAGLAPSRLGQRHAVKCALRCSRSPGARRAASASRWSRIDRAPVSRRATGFAGPGSDSTRFSGITERKGCISEAIEAGVDGVILYLQSGHCQAYMHLIASSKCLRPSASKWLD